MAEYLLFLRANAPWAIVLLIAVLGGSQLERMVAGFTRSKRRPRSDNGWRRPPATAEPKPFDAAEQSWPDLEWCRNASDRLLRRQREALVDVRLLRRWTALI